MTMYDARQEPNEFVADSLEEARAKAAEFFGTDASALDVVVPEVGEIFGAGGRTVIVAVPKGVATRGGRSSGGEGGRDGGRDGGERGGRREGRGGERGGRGERDRGARGGERGGRGDREERGDRGPRAERGEDRGERNDRGERGGRGDRPERSNGGGEPRVSEGRRERPESGGDRGRERMADENVDRGEKIPSITDSRGTAQGKLGVVGEFLLGAVERMKLGSFEISESAEGDFLIFQLRGAAAEALQRGDGRATDALQLVANQVSLRQSEDAPRVVVDVEGAGDEREQTMTRLAERAVKRARETGRSIALDPMNSRDRRAIHIVVREMSGVATMSIGEGRYRQVLVVPEGAPEYQEALAQSS
jgi:predicted RNA-binding protein Jag